MNYYKLFRSEAGDLAHRLGIVLPKTRKDLDIKVGEFIDDIKSHRVYLNKAKTIWIQPCHYYDGEGTWPKDSLYFEYEITHSTTESAFSRFMNANEVPRRHFTYNGQLVTD